MRKPVDGPYYKAFAEAADALANRDVEKARRALQPEMERIADAEYKRGSIAYTRMAAVFARDNYTCRYCGRRTIALPVLNAIADILPDVLSRDSVAWKPYLTDMVFFKLSTSLDHKQPVTRGGTQEPKNLVTACWLCNSMKQNYALEELEWDLLARPTDPWDGLSGVLEAIVEHQSLTKGYYRTWIRALRKPEDIRTWADPKD